MRGVNGYPQLLARLRGPSLVDVSCSGATVRHVRRGGQVFLGPQIDALSKDTALVTMTAGGNDIRYVGDLNFLAGRRGGTAFGWLLRRFWGGPLTEAQRDYAGLHLEMVATLREIRRRAPSARIVLVSYPTILPPAGTCARIGISTAEAAAMRVTGARLAAVTRAAADEGGAILIDMHTLGAAHHACSAEPWVNGWRDPAGAQFHPTREGAAATARVIDAALNAT